MSTRSMVGRTRIPEKPTTLSQLHPQMVEVLEAKMSIRKPTSQIEQMEKANVRPHWNSRRPETDIEAELADENRRKK